MNAARGSATTSGKVPVVPVNTMVTRVTLRHVPIRLRGNGRGADAHSALPKLEEAVRAMRHLSLRPHRLLQPAAEQSAS